MNDYKIIIDSFNDSHSIRYVIEVCTGEQIQGKSICCPIHGGDNKHGASIDTGKNIFTCWTSDCGRGVSPWGFVQKYYNLQGFKEVAEKVNSLFNENIPIYEKGVNNGDNEALNDTNFDAVYKVNQYLSECKELKTELQQHKHLLLNANTGLGKTHGIVDIHKDNNNDYVFFLVSTRALAEDVANEYGYELFYDNDSVLPNTKYIVSTYKKIYRIQEALNTKNYYRAMNNEFLVTYSVVVDEIHELMSKRNLTGGDCVREIESFILNSDDSILMSANTNNIYEAYKDTDLFSRYIKVESKENLYNSDKTYIYRIPGNEKQRYALLLDKITENLTTHANILLMEDSKSHLETYSKILSSKGIENVVINSDNKNDDDEILEEYNSIIKDSRLKKIVVLCTSVINAGVNIKNDNTCVICIQDRNQFDSDKAIQIFGRLRTDNNNTCILFLNQGEKRKHRSKKEPHINYYTNISNTKAMNLNQYFFNEYGLEPIENRIRIEWDFYKTNDGYKDVIDIIYINNGLCKVDHVAIHEKARLRWLKDNYYDDDFILELFKDLKTRELKIITLAPITDLEEINSDNEEDSESITLNKALENISTDIEAVKEFNAYIRGGIKPKDFINENNINLYDNFKANKLYKEMKHNLITINNGLLITKDSAPPISTMLNVMREYQLEQTKKERDENIKNIKRVEFYNKQFPLGRDDINIQGDNIYYIVRKNCDCFVKNRHQLSKTAYNCMIKEYIELYDCRYESGQLLDKKGKKIKPETVQTLFNNCIISIYNCTEKMFLTNLK